MSHRRALFLSALVLGACTELPERDEDRLPDWDAGYDDTDVVDTGDTGDQPSDAPYALRIPDRVDYKVRLRTSGTDDEPCEIFPDGTTEGFVEAECTLDIPELNLFGNGLDFEYLVPPGVCDYVVYWHYMYEAWEVGVGPSTVEITLDADGEIVSETNAVNGTPVCPYDYSAQIPDAPNCCLGTYTVEVTDAEGDTTTSETQFWEGRPADCYGGAAFIDPEAVLTDDGWPVAKIVYTNQGAFNKQFAWDELSDEFQSNVPLANHYEPADHGGTMPAGFTGSAAQPYYTFQCYDQAEELLAELRLVVEEWNEVEQFEAAEGDPDSTGTEPVTGTPLDDRNDWATATPGDSTWIQFGE